LAVLQASTRRAFAKRDGITLNHVSDPKSPASLRVKVWGARGSLPSPLTPVELHDHVRNLLVDSAERGHKSAHDVDRYLATLPRQRLGGYGGNTPCIEVSTAQQQVIIDGGSGIRQLGYDLMCGPCGRGTGVIHILFTHFHWDHLIGLLFFTPIFIPGNKVHVYAVQPELPEVFDKLFRKPYFPVQLEQLGASIEYHRLEPRTPLVLGDITATPYELDHPDPCWGFRLEGGGKSFSHCVDTECIRISREELGPDLPMYQNLDLMIIDAQYTVMEAFEKINWGHASARRGIDIAMRENIKHVLFMHHDPGASMGKIAAAETQARLYYEHRLESAKQSGAPLHAVDWSFTYDGQTIDL
jgi:phosphoribosyl 1,2-cyclic phosphodiesterase